MTRTPLPWLRRQWAPLLPLLHRLGGSRRMGLGSGLVLLLTLLLSSNLLPDTIHLQVGDVSPEEIRAHRTVAYYSTEETQRLRSHAVQRVPNVYDEIPYATSDAIDNVNKIFRLIEGAKARDGDLSDAERAALRQRLPVSLSDLTIRTLLNTKPDGLYSLRAAAERLVGRVMSGPINDMPSDIPKVRLQVNAEVRSLPAFSSAERVALADIVGHAIRPNRMLNPQRTERLREQERLSVQPIPRPILRGEVILSRNEPVTREHVDKLLALGLQQPALNWSRMAFLSLILGVLVYLFSLYLREYHREIYQDFPRLVLLALLVTVSVLGLKLGASVLGLKFYSSTVGYLNMLWICTAAMLVAALVGPNVAVPMAALLAVGTGLGLDIDLRFVAAAFVSSLAGIYAASHLRDRSSLIRMGVTLCVTNAAIVLCLSGLAGDLWGNFLLGLGWAVGCGLGAALLFWLGVALLERPFGVTTHVGLLELCDTNHPILKRMLMEAPGTYHHSMVVAQLAEGAAEAIGADSLLVRTMAYYHDIGKIRRPQFFIENQRIENVHDRLNPSLSMLVIAAHVRDGVEIAREIKLPPPILDGIREHHGTGLVTYFYHQATQGTCSPSADLEQQFRYDGPKPQSKETAILMLADGVEASSRVLSKATPGQIEDLVGRILHDRLNDGQLDECD
ncbi:MAG: HDIG domain-containing protein, partial [Armatimonadetes bacterium]|nr:HDIG domain-containing protein [Armatimonadota bacterium]